jgi:hypothetical protein
MSRLRKRIEDLYAALTPQTRAAAFIAALERASAGERISPAEIQELRDLARDFDAAVPHRPLVRVLHAWHGEVDLTSTEEHAIEALRRGEPVPQDVAATIAADERRYVALQAGYRHVHRPDAAREAEDATMSAEDRSLVHSRVADELERAIDVLRDRLTADEHRRVIAILADFEAIRDA